jgi:hypothetical protein
MTWIIDTKSNRLLSARLAAGLVSAMLVLGTSAVPAYADRDGDGLYHQNWNRGYYPGPAVVYGSPYGQPYYGQAYYGQPYYGGSYYGPAYYPPRVYGPGIGISVPGVSIGIQ